MKNLFKKKRTWIVLVLLVIAAWIVFVPKKNNNLSGTSEGTASRMDITEYITGSGVINPKDQYSITTLVSGEVLSADFEEGDIVSKDSVLYKIDASDAEKSIESASIALERSRHNYSTASKNLSDTNIKASNSGIIKTLYIKAGDSVQNGSKVADIYDDSVMELVLPFNESDIPNLYNGASVTVDLVGSGMKFQGSISHIATAAYTKYGNMRVCDVTVHVANTSKAIKSGDKATAYVGDIYCNDSGTFKYLVEETVTAKASGDVASLNYKQGDYINGGSTIASLSSDSLSDNIYSSSLSVRDSILNLEKASDQLDDYTITTPISGTVVTKNMKAGDKIDNKNSSEPLAVIYDLSSLKFTMNIDELDISKIAVGQEVSITATALGDKKYKGMIEKVSLNSTASNGTTTYPVTVVVMDFDEGLLPGMNVDAEIVVQKSENVLAVPVSAVQRGNVVYVKGTKENSEDTAPEGYKTVKVETGISNSEVIEIKSGLSEGDKVYLPGVKSNTMNINQMGAMQGIQPGGGAPQGGAPQGGAPQGGGQRQGGGR